MEEALVGATEVGATGVAGATGAVRESGHAIPT